MNPPPTPPEEGSQCRGTLDEFPSWEGPGVGRFMGREHLQNSDVNRSHEPVGIPLNRPSGTFSPIGGEGRDEGVRFMERIVRCLSAVSATGFAKPVCVKERPGGGCSLSPRERAAACRLSAKWNVHAS